ncbi:MAG: type II toxin-antitoxin system prevent-host-death family antitoxin [Desulfobulbaceae bacterium]|jgi:prevent-host-death family protein|nr:type II toxin-antitoxin system prevent-host-death family antitoxin [Desulfobulbaceae bacterium]
MRQVNIHEAKTHLSRLLDGISQGQSFVIAKAGKPIARVIPYAAESQPANGRLGFLRGCCDGAAKVKDVGAEEIRAMFEDDK